MANRCFAANKVNNIRHKGDLGSFLGQKNAVTRSESAQSEQYQQPGQQKLGVVSAWLTRSRKGLRRGKNPLKPPPLYVRPVSLMYAHIFRRLRADSPALPFGAFACNSGHLLRRPRIRQFPGNHHKRQQYPIISTTRTTHQALRDTGAGYWPTLAGPALPFLGRLAGFCSLA